MRVLLVDHDPDTRATIETALQTRGHLVRTGHNFRAAVEACRVQSFPLVIIDQDCLDPDRGETLDRLKKYRRDAANAFVVLTASDADAAVPPSGATQVWSRSIAASDLARRVAALERMIHEADAYTWNVAPSPPTARDFESQLSGRQAVVLEAHREVNDAIAERHHAETALAEAEARYAELVREARDAVLVVQHGEIVLANDAAAELLGVHDPDHLTGRALRTFCHPDTVAQTIGETAGASRDSFVSRMVRLDGRVRTAHVTRSGITLSSLPAMQLILRDITPQRTAETRRRQLEAQLAALLDQIPEIVMTVAPEGTITSFNRSPVRGDPLGENLMDLVSTHDRERLRAALEQVASTGSADAFALQIQDGDEAVWFEARFGPIRDGDAIEWILAVLRRAGPTADAPAQDPHPPAQPDDRATLLVGNARLERLAAIAGAAARDGGALLSSASTQIAGLLKDMSRRSPYRNHLEAVDQLVAHAGEVAGELQRVAALQARDAEPVDLGTLIREMRDLLEGAMPEGTTLEVSTPQNLPQTALDPGSFRRALLTLALDAADAAGSSGSVRIIAGEPGTRDTPLTGGVEVLAEPKRTVILLDVIDSGPPIDAGEVAELRMPQPGPRGRRMLGLAAVRQMAQALGAGMVVGRREDHETVVRLLLPPLPAGRGNGRRGAARGSSHG